MTQNEHKSTTQDEFTVKDSFTLVDEILTQDSDLCMAALGKYFV